MEPENISAGSTPPADCIDDGAVEKLSSEVLKGRHSEPHEWNQGGEDEEKLPQEVARTCTDHTQFPFNNLPDVEHKDMELRAKERIDKLQFDLDVAEKKLEDSHKEHLQEVSLLQHKLQSSASIGENKMKLLESESARLVEELNASKEEVSDLKRHLKNAKLGHGELESQVDGLKGTVHVLEKELKDSNEQAKETKEKLLKQIDACQAELDTKAKVLESINKAHSDLQLELQEVNSKNQEILSAVKEQVCSLEAMLKSAQDEVKSKEAAALLLQTENDKLQSMISKHSTASEERLKQREEEHQEELKAYEERCKVLEKFVAKLEERNKESQDSIGAARSDAEVARGKIADIELELEALRQSEQAASEFQAQVRSMEEMVSKQVDSLKIAEEDRDTARQQVVHLQGMLKTTEEQLRVRKEAADSLQQQVVELTLKEERSVKHRREVEDSSHTMQVELQSKLEVLEATVPQLEEKVAQLQDLLVAAKLDSDGARNRVSELEAELASLQHNECELSERIKLCEDKCSQKESNAETLKMRIKELEGSITEFRSEAVVLNAKVATLEASLEDSRKEVTDLEMQLGLVKDSSLLLENRRIAELEKNSEEYLSKIEGLHKMLAERQKEINSFTNKTNELTLSIQSLESDLKSALEKELLANEERAFLGENLVRVEALTSKLEAERSELESSMHQHESLVEKGKIDLHEASVREKELRATITTLQTALSELQASLSQTEEEKQATATQLESAMQNFTELNDQLAEERLQLQQQTATIMQENEDLRKKNAGAQEKLRVALAAAELSAKQVQEGSLKESTLRDQVEDLKAQLRKAHDARVNAETLEQEKGNLAQKLASAEEKLHATVEAAELSAKGLQAASLREETLNAEIEDLKIQLGKAMDVCSHVDGRTLENSIKTEAHQTQTEETLTASRLKVADEQLPKSQPEMKDIQNPVGPEIPVRGLDMKTTKGMESFKEQPSDFSKMREVDLDAQSPGKVRSRKKKGVTWETDTILKTKAIHKPQQNSVWRFNHYVAHIFIALASLTIGFWLASKVYA